MPNTVRNLAAQQLGEIKFDGARHSTRDLSGDQFAYATIKIPNPLPPEWVGKVSRITAYADVNGDPPAFKWMAVGPNLGEWGSPIGNPACSQGQTVTINVAFGVARKNAVLVQGGETIYVNVQNRMPYFGWGSLDTASSCGPGHQADFTMDASIPGAVG